MLSVQKAIVVLTLLLTVFSEGIFVREFCLIREDQNCIMCAQGYVYFNEKCVPVTPETYIPKCIISVYKEDQKSTKCMLCEKEQNLIEDKFCTEIFSGIKVDDCVFYIKNKCFGCSNGKVVEGGICKEDPKYKDVCNVTLDKSCLEYKEKGKIQNHKNEFIDRKDQENCLQVDGDNNCIICDFNYGITREGKCKSVKRFPWLLFIVILLGVLILVAAAILIYRKLKLPNKSVELTKEVK